MLRATSEGDRYGMTGWIPSSTAVLGSGFGVQGQEGSGPFLKTELSESFNLLYQINSVLILTMYDPHAEYENFYTERLGIRRNSWSAVSI